MHIFDMSATYLQSVEKINESSKRSWFHKEYTIKHYLLGAKSENV